MRNFLFILIFSIFFCFCKSNDSECHLNLSNSDSITIDISDTLVNELVFSPLNGNKVLLSIKNQFPAFEIDMITHKQNSIDTFMSNYYKKGVSPIIEKDNYEPIKWISSNNFKLKKYNEITKKLDELQLEDVFKIKQLKEKVYFVARSGLYYWDRKNQKIEKSINIPDSISISTNAIFFDNGNIIIPDYSITYDNKASSFKKGIFLDTFEYKGRFNNIKIVGNIAVVYENDSIYVIYKNQKKVLNINKKDGYSFNSLYNLDINVNYPFVTTFFNDTIYDFDVEKSEMKISSYYLPLVNTATFIDDRTAPFFYKNGIGYFSNIENMPKPNYLYDKNRIYIFRQNQLHIIDRKRSQNYNFPIPKDMDFRSCMIDDCNIYLLFKGKIIIESKENFIKKCQLFDPIEYQKPIKEYNDFVEKLLYFEDTSLYSVINKLHTIHHAYGKSGVSEIEQKLQKLDVDIFESLKVEAESVYVDEGFPIEYRKKVLYNLVKQFSQKGQFNKSIFYESEYYRLFADRNVFGTGDYSTIKVIHRYIEYSDSLDKTKMPNDEKAFNKAKKLFEVSQTEWFEGEACYDVSLGLDALKKLILNYPNSSFRDDAEYISISSYYCDEGGADDNSLKDRIMKLNDLLKRYPHSNLFESIERDVFAYACDMSVKDYDKLKKQGNLLLFKYPKSKFLEDTKSRLSILEREN